jgi:predicted enzyme related to lactoylglutathione lyase
MATVTQHAPGTFCWPELATSDAAGAKKFYGALLGWDFADNDMGDGMMYTMIQLKGNVVGALYGQKAEDQKRMPPHWGAYVSVESADRSAAKAKELGGTLLMEPFDVNDIGRMAVIQDPTGAIFSLWEAKKHIGAGVLNEPGSLTWTELMTPNTDKAAAFYTGLFPWKTESMEMPNMTYTMFMRGDQSAGGMMPILPEQMGQVPPNWLSYFAVENVDPLVPKAEQLGATVIVPAMSIPNGGKFAVFRDPAGAHFGIYQAAKGM